MFTALTTAAVIAGSAVAMPPVVHNDWAGVNQDWAPLTAKYEECAKGHDGTYFGSIVVYFCGIEAREAAIKNQRSA